MKKLKFTKQITKRTELSVEKYLNEINKEPLLTAQEEVELAGRIKNGDEEALEKLIKSNLRFVVSVAKKYEHQGLGLADLINEGNLGLIKAAKRFDATRGFKFISYAVWWIRQSILQALAEKARPVRLPSNKVNVVSKIDQAQSELMQKQGREPSTEELAGVLEWAPQELVELMAGSEKAISMDAPLTDEEGASIQDMMKSEAFPAPDQRLTKESSNQELQEILNHQLTEKESTIIKSYYGLENRQPRRLEEIGRILRLCPERVRQLRKQALQKLRDYFRFRKDRSSLN
jgi:RNA polymerase primary sigma factor